MQQHFSSDTDRVSFGLAAVFLGAVAAGQFGKPGHLEDIAAIMGITVVVMGLVAISFDGERPVPPWKKSAAEWQRLKSYVAGVLATVPVVIWLGWAVSLNNEWGVVVYFAPAAVLGLGIFGYLAIGRRVLRRRLMREEFKVEP